VSARKLRFRADSCTALRAKRARAEPARSLLLGHCFVGCGASMLARARVASVRLRVSRAPRRLTLRLSWGLTPKRSYQFGLLQRCTKLGQLALELHRHRLRRDGLADEHAQVPLEAVALATVGALVEVRLRLRS